MADQVAWMAVTALAVCSCIFVYTLRRIAREAREAMDRQRRTHAEAERGLLDQLSARPIIQTTKPCSRPCCNDTKPTWGDVDNAQR